MTTKEHVYELVERLDQEQIEELERELVRRLDSGGERDPHERPYDPLGKIIDLVGDEYEGPTDVSSDKYRYVADAIEANWVRG